MNDDDYDDEIRRPLPPGWRPRSAQEARWEADWAEHLESQGRGQAARTAAESGPVRWWDHAWWFITGEGHVRAPGYWFRRVNAAIISWQLLDYAFWRIGKLGINFPNSPMLVSIGVMIVVVAELLLIQTVWRHMVATDHVSRRFMAFLKTMRKADIDIGMDASREADRKYRESISLSRLYRAWRARGTSNGEG